MIRLMLCQIKQLMPFVLLWFALIGIFFGLQLATGRIDELSYLDWCGDYCNVGSDANLVLLNVLLYMIACYSLFPREFDDQTIDFVRSLPVSRVQIFLAKVLAAILLLCLLNIVEMIIQSALSAFNIQTLTGRKYWANDGWILLRDFLFVFVMVAHGVFISWFRTIGLVLYCVYLVGLVWLEQALGYSGPYSLFRFYNNEYDGQRILFDWPVIGTQVLIAAFLLFAGFILWTRTDSKPKTSGSGKFAQALPTILSVMAFVTVALGLIGLMIQAGANKERDNIQRLASNHYQFAYRLRDEARLLELRQYADDDYQALVKLLNMSDEPFIQTDMTSNNSHAVGLAAYKKIRMVLSGRESVNPEYRRILSHETAHVFQGTESNRKLASAGNSVGFFIEGMAQYTSFTIVPDPSTRETNWAVSSVSWKRHNISFAELANRAAFESLYDPELLYGIGDIWVEAMVRQCGIDSLGDFLRSTARKDAPPNLPGVAYWRYHLQHIGCELQLVNRQWQQLMQQTIDEGTNGAFPTFKNVVISQSDSNIVISSDVTPDDTGRLPSRYYLRVKGETKLANTVSPIRPGLTTQTAPTVKIEFTVPRSEFEGKRFSYQLGYVPYPDSRYYFEKWRSGTLPN